MRKRGLSSRRFIEEHVPAGAREAALVFRRHGRVLVRVFEKGILLLMTTEPGVRWLRADPGLESGFVVDTSTHWCRDGGWDEATLAESITVSSYRLADGLSGGRAWRWLPEKPQQCYCVRQGHTYRSALDPEFGRCLAREEYAARVSGPESMPMGHDEIVYLDAASFAWWLGAEGGRVQAVLTALGNLRVNRHLRHRQEVRNLWRQWRRAVGDMARHLAHPLYESDHLDALLCHERLCRLFERPLVAAHLEEKALEKKGAQKRQDKVRERLRQPEVRDIIRKEIRLYEHVGRLKQIQAALDAVKHLLPGLGRQLLLEDGEFGQMIRPGSRGRKPRQREP